MRTSGQTRKSLRILTTAALLILGPHLVAVSASEEAEGIDPSDVFVQVRLLRQELESIRFVMGRPQCRQPEIHVAGATSREVYYQARTLLRKADQLCFEQTRERAVEVENPSQVPTSADVAQVVQAALDRVQRVSEALGVKAPANVRAPDAHITPTHIFRSIVQANRQLNLLLDKQFTPSDVFLQVTEGVSYTSRLLEEFPQATTIPNPPQYEIGKRPSDVYQRLVNCFERIRRISELSGEHVLEFNPKSQPTEEAEPSDVYDVASLLVAELVYLHSLAGAKPARRAYDAGRRFPSHVYQRAGLLEKQLIELESLVEQNPDWLQQSSKGP